MDVSFNYLTKLLRTYSAQKNLPAITSSRFCSVPVSIKEQEIVQNKSVVTIVCKTRSISLPYFNF